MNASSIKPSTECGNCGFSDRWLLHYVRLRGEHRRLCTSCVLKLHPTSFCAICFELFEASVARHETIVCQKCPSVAHAKCVPDSDDNAVAKSYVCPSCSDSKFVFFDAKRNGDMQLEVDFEKSKVLVCAGRIAVESMSRAVHVVDADAHRRVKEAAVSRKRAKEALQEIWASVEKMRKVGEEDGRPVGSANGVDQNGVGNSSVVVRGSLSNVGLQNRASGQGVVLGSGGNVSVAVGEEKRGQTSNVGAGRSVLAGNGVTANSTKVDNVGNTRNGDAEDRK